MQAQGQHQEHPWSGLAPGNRTRDPSAWPSPQMFCPSAFLPITTNPQKPRPLILPLRPENPIIGPQASFSRKRRCLSCETRFASEQQYETHIHDSCKHHYCTRCNGHFESSECFRQHRTNSDAHNLCTRCDVDFKSRKELVQHWASADQMVHAYCPGCDQHFGSPTEERNHYLQDTRHTMTALAYVRPVTRRQVRCKEFGCAALFACNYEMNLHFLSTHREVFECPVPTCRMKFITFESRENHRRKCEEEKIPCKHPSCAAGFADAALMQQHWNALHAVRATSPNQERTRSSTPSENQGFICPVEGCARRLEDIDSQIRHFVKHHAYCQACSNETGGRLFRNHEELEDHLREGLPGHSYCWVCRMMFNDVATLEVHCKERHGKTKTLPVAKR